MKVVVTGASGFVGREAIAPLLEIGATVHCLGRTRGDLPSAVEFHAVDLVDGDSEPLLREIAPSHLLHMAWYAEPGKFWQAPENLDWVAASLRLTRAFAAAGGARAVFAGSCAEYDWSHDHLDEQTTPLAPASLYGQAKACLFQLVSRAAPVLGLSVGWGRIFFPYGPYEHPARLTATALDAAIERRPAEFTAGTQVREFIHVDDVAGALVALLDSELEGAVNIAAGEPVPVRTLVETVARLGSAADCYRFGSKPLQPGEPARMTAATDRLRRELGYAPRFSLADGLADALERRRFRKERS